MPFQSIIYQQQALGVPGTRFDNSPMRALPYTLNSVSEAYNIIGQTAYTQTVVDEQAAAGNASGTAVFAGILVNPEMHASFGASSRPLNPTMTLNNYTQATLTTMGRFVVNLLAAANIGDLVVFDNTTGAISTIAPGAALPVGKSFAFAQVIKFTVTVAGPAVIEISPTLVIPS